MDARDPPNAPGLDTADETLYDAYLDAALDGDAGPPEDFLARHPQAGAALRARIEALHRMMLGEAVRPVASAARPAAAEGLPFERLGDFRLLRRLDEGGMGTVYLAEQESLGRIVAVKVVREDLAASPSAAARFEREALAIARLRHPNIVTAFSVGEDQGVRYLAMEFVPGSTLDELLADAAERGAPLRPAEVVRYATQIARALHAAHEEGIVHRDVKPANVRVTPEGRPLLLDFGIARDTDGLALTLTGPFVGSPVYAAPEQIAEGPIDARTDVYGLGVTLYECLVGRPPFDTGTMEQVFHRVLHADPVPARSLNPAISRDLDVVIATAMEKDPARRYASAAAFADDLDALLEFRPIRARPPGPLARLAKWARRNRATAAALLVLALAAGGFVVSGALERRAEARRVRESARAKIAQARELLDTLGGSRERDRALERRVDALRGSLFTKHLTPEQDAELDRNEDAVAHARRDREAGYHRALALLREAEALHAAAADVDALRGRLYLEKWREADAREDREASRFYAGLARLHDPSGAGEAFADAPREVVLRIDPPDAEVFLFRYELASDEKRLVPVPVPGAAGDPADAASAPAPGTTALRVVRGAGTLCEGDLVVELDGAPIERDGARTAVARAQAGGVAARVHPPRELFDGRLPAGLVVRATSCPLPLGRRGVAHGGRIELRLHRGEYVAVARAAGRELRRAPFAVDGGGRRLELEVELLPAGSTPVGFVHVAPRGADAPAPFWIMEREVTAAEYLEFLDDADTLRRLDAGEGPPLVPRDHARGAAGAYWSRGADGRFALPADWAPDWPALGLGYEDALAYVAWRNRRAAAGRADGGPDATYTLPTFDEWIAAALGDFQRFYVFGNTFRPKWMKSCFARPQANPEPVLGYPVDESVYGVFDMAGGAWEWCAEWYDEPRGLQRILGGSWGRADADSFKVFGGRGLMRDDATGETGFRLVLRRAGDDR